MRESRGDERGGTKETHTQIAGKERRGEEREEKRGHSLDWQEKRGEERREKKGNSL